MSLRWPRHVPIAVSLHGGLPENVHRGSFAVVDRAGRVLTTAGDVDTPAFTRSSLKPLQALPLIARAAQRLPLQDEDIALLCAGHNGEPAHVARAAALLARMGADESALTCGTHEPYVFRFNGLTPPPGERHGPLHHNCSGQHAGMLLLADTLGAPWQG